jgi:hypothetical protein
MRFIFRVFACLIVLATCAAAAEITPEGARALATTLRTWFARMLGPDAPELPVTATAAGDHYRVLVPLVGLRTENAVPAVTASARPLPDGRWALDDVRLPPRFSIATPELLPFARHGRATVTVADQRAHALIDPSLASPSSFDVQLAGIVVTTTGAHVTREQHIDHYTATGSLVPATDGLLDLTEDATMAGWRSAAVIATGHAVGSAVRHAAVHVEVKGLAADRVGPTVSALVSFGVALPEPTIPPQVYPDLTPQAYAALHRLVLALRGIATSGRLDETLDGVQFEIAGIGAAAADRVRIGTGGTASGGFLHAWFDIGIDDLSVPGLPSDSAILLPRRIALRPTVSGVPITALNRLLAAATEPGGAAAAARDRAALFAAGSLTIGIDALQFVIGPATFDGAGSLMLLSPTEREGQVRLAAKGFDALAEQIRNNPAAQGAWPVLAMVRGLAKPEGDRLVWLLSLDRSGKLTVNGADLSALLGGLHGKSGVP